jgi:hypothetical protein
MTPPSSPRAGRSTVSTAGEPQRPPDEWLLSISIMEAARRIGLEMVVGHSWRELAMLTNTILADQLAAASPAGPGIRNRLLVSRFDPSVSLDELIGAGSEAVPQSERPDAALRVEYNLGRRHGYEEGYRAAQSEAVPQSEREGLDDSDIAALHELERDLAANEVEHMGDVWQRLRAILDAPGQRALAARLASPAHPDEE